MTSCQDVVDLDRAFESYDRRFAEAALRLPERLPWVDADRDEIRLIIRRCLGIRDEWIPAVKIRARMLDASAPAYTVERIQFESWPRCYGSAFLYGPTASPAGPAPIVLIACGHGLGGKFAYRTLAENLARSGCFALIPDNIGQGEREPMGHRDVVGVFDRGLSVQGLIVMESMGWLNWINEDARFDRERVAVVGNSGGGTISHFLGALDVGSLAAIACSGYPSSYSWIHRKEKKLCHCNLLPGIVGELEMWQVLGAIAPRPLFLFQGKEDNLFPAELFLQTARRVQAAYAMRAAEMQVAVKLIRGEHSWDRDRRIALVEWLGEVLAFPFQPEALVDPSVDAAPAPCFEAWPTDARSTDAVAEFLSGRSSRAVQMREVYPPAVTVPATAPQFMRAEIAELFAQYEAGLCDRSSIASACD